MLIPGDAPRYSSPSDLPMDELLLALAEEATELAQAAMKLRRTLVPFNPTPKEYSECYDALIEEHADVCNCFKALEWNDKERREEIMAEKWKRWEERLNR